MFAEISVSLKYYKNNCDFCIELCIFMNIIFWLFLRFRNISEERSRRNPNTHLMLNNSFHKLLPYVIKSENVYSIDWNKYMVLTDSL